MDISTQQRLLYLLAGVCLLGTAGVVYWSTGSVEQWDVAGTGDGSQELAAEPDDTGAPAVDDDKLSESLRGPLYDPPPTTPPPVAPTPAPVPTPVPRKPKLDLTLVGTIIDSDESLAIISDASGKFDVKGIGESLELTPAGVRIEEIKSEQITLRYQGNEATIQLEKSNPSKDASKRTNNRRRNQ